MLQPRRGALLYAAPALAVLLGVTGALAQPAAPAPSSASASPPPAPGTPAAAPGVSATQAPNASSSEEPAQAPAAAPPVDEAKRAEAKKVSKELIKEAKKLLDRKEYAAALAQYQAAFRVYPGWSSRAGAGVCLVKLQRYDEAQEVFESIVRDFGATMPEPAKAQALEQINVMRTVTGGFNVTEAEVGALVVIDGRVRGEHPSASPLSVLVGPHLVRVYKVGFALFEKSVDVSKGQVETLPVKLERLVEEKAGRLKVGEVDGKKMEVIVDGVPVGTTPWEGPVSAGEHSVVLRQLSPPLVPSSTCGEPPFAEDINKARFEDTIATTPVMVVVRPKETSPVQLKAEPLGAKVKILPVPATAEVFVDGVHIARGGFEGRLKSGEHVVKAEAEGYFAETRKITIAAGDEGLVELTLRKDYNAPIWAEAGHYLIELGGTAPLSPTFGGDLASSCSDTCQASLGAGGRIALRIGYEQSSGFGFGGTAGYMALSQSTVSRRTTLNGLGSNGEGNDLANDVITIQSVMLGAYAGYRIGKRVPVRVGVSAGVGLGGVSDVRTGLIGDYAIGPATQSGFFTWIFVEPELRVGLHLTDHLALGVSLSGLVLIAPSVPRWNAEMKVNSHDLKGTAGTFDAESITGSTIFAITQGLHVAYEF